MARSAWGERLNLPGGLGRGRRWGDPAWTLVALCQAWLMGAREGRWPLGVWTARRPEGPRPLGPPTAFVDRPDPGWVSLLRHGTPQAAPWAPAPRESLGETLAWEALGEGDLRPWMAYGAVLLPRAVRLAWIPWLGQVTREGVLDLPPLLEGLLPEGVLALPPGWWARLLWEVDAQGRLVPRPGEVPGRKELEVLGAHGQALDSLVLAQVPETLVPWAHPLPGLGWVVDPGLRAWVRGFGAAGDHLGRLWVGGDPGAPHPACQDAGGWMAWGRSREGHDAVHEALWAYACAEGHARRSGDLSGARVACAEAFQMARRAGALAVAERLRDRRDGLDAAELAFDRGESREALALLEAEPESWSPRRVRLQARLALDMGDRDLGSRALPEVAGALGRLLRAWLAGEPLPVDLGGDLGLEVAAMGGAPFWEAWEGAVSRPRKLALGLRRLESFPEEATPERLAVLGAWVCRMGTTTHPARLAALWGKGLRVPESQPGPLIEAWQRAQPEPTWVLCGLGPGARWIGPQGAPPALVAQMAEVGHLAPVRLSGRLWWGRALQWEGRVVGGLLQVRPDHGAWEAPLPADPGSGVDPALLAPWIAKLESERPNAREGTEEAHEAGLLLADGTEPMGSVLREARRMAPTPLAVLLLGPTGSGKELLAREIHRWSGRKGALVSVNCAALAEGVLESELFGHVKGAFTGADRTRAGAFEAANGGTLFLDEVADLGPRTQSLLLRALQEGEVRKVGSDTVCRVDVRIVAATHLDLEARTTAGAFRRDLLYRLKGCVLGLPTLAERRHEFAYLIPRLVARQAQVLQRKVPALAPGLVEALAGHPWPGNFRELGHALARALVRAGGDRLERWDFPELDTLSPAETAWSAAHQAFRRRFLLESLQRHGFQVAETARALGLARPALYQAARQAGLDLVAERRRFEARGA